MGDITRREMMRWLVAWGLSTAGASALLSACSPSPAEPTASPTQIPGTSIPTLSPTRLVPTETPNPTATSTLIARPSPTPAPSAAYLAVARGERPADLVHAALKALGGIEHFVKPGHDVIIKPNICVAYHTYEYAATTNPEVVGALVALCMAAGAKRVRVMDFPFGGTPEQAYAKSGIGEAVKAAGGQMEVMSRMKLQKTPIPGGRDLKNWPVYRDALEADVLIDVPIAKHHSLARLTLGMKNLMGLVDERNRLHSNLGQRLADLASLMRPTLTVVDAVRILMDHGPTGGRLSDVKQTNTVIASHDIVAADAYATTLFGLTGADIPAVRAGAEMGLGTMDLRSVQVEEIST